MLMVSSADKLTVSSYLQMHTMTTQQQSLNLNQKTMRLLLLLGIKGRCKNTSLTFKSLAELLFTSATSLQRLMRFGFGKDLRLQVDPLATLVLIADFWQ